jgi:capsular polysaccharide export protein
LKKTFLFLQGPHSWFYQRLADQLESLGHKCLRINLCFSDWFFWQRSGGSNYRGTLVNWEAYLAGYLNNKSITDIVLLGEQRNYHKVAVDLAKLRGIQVTVTEWGYLRPDWITLEREGMSGNSIFTRNPEEILKMAKGISEPDFTHRHKDCFRTMAIQGLIGDVGSSVFGFLYPGYRSHLLANPIKLYIGTGLKRWRAKRQMVRTRRTIHRWVAKPKLNPLFILPMQIEADYQVRAYSKFPDLVVMLEEVIQSFGRHAPENARLMVKLHPMDPGFRSWGRIVAQAASQAGAGSRVVLIDGGSFEFLVKRCAGVVTVNSTAGVTAIKAGKPVKTLGQAVYNVPGLVFQGPLDEFWGNAEAPNAELRRAYIKALSACIQVKGGFFSESGLSAAVEEAALRLDKDLVNHPLKRETL